MKLGYKNFVNMPKYLPLPLFSRLLLSECTNKMTFLCSFFEFIDWDYKCLFYGFGA